MKPNPVEILRRITDGTLLSAEAISGLDHDTILDRRDGDEAFEAHWTRCYNEIEAKWPAAKIDSETEKLAEDIRRESFLTVSRSTSQHEIASYVSDDFDIIVRGAILGIRDDFLDDLWDAYDHNGIPAPDVG